MKAKKILCVLLILVLALISLTSCKDVASDGTVTVVLSAGEGSIREYTVSYKSDQISKGLISVLDLLKARGDIDYELSGTMLSFVKDTEDESILVGNDYAASTYLWVYTSVEKDYSVASFFDTEYNGVVLKSSDFGTADMTVEDGAIFYIGTVQWK